MVTHHLYRTVNKATAKSRLLKIIKCVTKSKTVCFTLKWKCPTLLRTSSSPTVDAQAKLRKDTGRETI